MAGTYNIGKPPSPPFTAGDTLEFSVTLAESDGVTTRDLTGYTAKAQIRQTVQAAEVLAEFTIKNAPLGSSGVVTLRLEAAETEVFRTIASSVWDLEITRTSDGTRTTVLSGTVTAVPDVTRE